MIGNTTDTRAASRTVGMRDWMNAFKPVMVIAFAGLLLFLIDVGCPFRFFFGISCPGCGLTRAWLAFFTGDVIRAFSLHPLFWAPVAAIVLFGMSPKLGSWATTVALLLCIAVIVLWTLRMGSAVGLFEQSWVARLDPTVVGINEPTCLEWLSFIG